MDKEYEKKYHELEEKNWWFVARREMLIKQLKALKVPSDAKILDIGSSGGALGLDLRDAGYTNFSLLDYSQDAVNLCKERGMLNAYCMDGHNPEFPEASFDLIIASDCLEHLKDDILALSNWYKLLETNGKLIVYVPAFQYLWSDHDVVNHHFRRYTKNELVSKLKQTSIHVIESGYWNFMLYFPTFVVRKLSNVFKKGKSGVTAEHNNDDLIALSAWQNKMLISLLRVENKLMQYSPFPIGVSTYAIAQKTEKAKS